SFLGVGARRTGRGPFAERNRRGPCSRLGHRGTRARGSTRRNRRPRRGRARDEAPRGLASGAFLNQRAAALTAARPSGEHAALEGPPRKILDPPPLFAVVLLVTRCPRSLRSWFGMGCCPRARSTRRSSGR